VTRHATREAPDHAADHCSNWTGHGSRGGTGSSTAERAKACANGMGIWIAFAPDVARILFVSHFLLLIYQP